ncbi:hypothetical protein [Clostridium sp.]|uniref:hypothetical protein n=1 Tax=Clostridium sp. TaxID=1506 RepID=UPI003463FAC3
MIALLKYNCKTYIKSNKFIIPFLILCIFQLLSYNITPVNFTYNMITFANLIFFIMAYMGFSYCEMQDSVTEQIVFLKVRNNNLYWISKILFIWVLGIIISLIEVILPVVINILSGGTFFQSEVTLSEVILAIVINILVALMGILLGMIFQTKIIGDKNSAVMGITFIALISVIKGPLVKEFPIAKVITWILPPVYDIASLCASLGRFSLSVLSIPIIYGVIYILIVIFIYIKLMKKLLF